VPVDNKLTDKIEELGLRFEVIEKRIRDILKAPHVSNHG
jgi:hypothetical protein